MHRVRDRRWIRPPPAVPCRSPSGRCGTAPHGRLLDRLVDRVELAVVREERLDVGGGGRAGAPRGRAVALAALLDRIGRCGSTKGKRDQQRPRVAGSTRCDLSFGAACWPVTVSASTSYTTAAMFRSRETWNVVHGRCLRLANPKSNLRRRPHATGGQAARTVTPYLDMGLECLIATILSRAIIRARAGRP